MIQEEKKLIKKILPKNVLINNNIIIGTTMLFARIYYLKLSFPIASGTKPFYTYFYKIQIKNENNKRYNVNFTQSQKKNKIKKYQYYYDNIFILFTYVNANILTYV